MRRARPSRWRGRNAPQASGRESSTGGPCLPRSAPPPHRPDSGSAPPSSSAEPLAHQVKRGIPGIEGDLEAEILLHLKRATIVRALNGLQLPHAALLGVAGDEVEQRPANAFVAVGRMN